MANYPAGTVGWATDPTAAHDDRPVIVLSHEYHPFSATDCTVMCAGTAAARYAHPTPELTDEHVAGISFQEPTYLMPWALYTIPPNAIASGRATGQLTASGETLVKKELIRLFEL